MQSEGFRIGSFIVVVGLFAATANAGDHGNPFLHRDGAAEAQSDVAYNKPIKVLFQRRQWLHSQLYKSRPRQNCDQLKGSSKIFVLFPEAAS